MTGRTIIILFTSLLICAITFVPIEYSYSQMDVVVIVHKKMPRLSKKYIKLVFTGYITNWPDGEKIRIIINKDSSLKELFFSNYLEIPTDKFYNIWERKKIRLGVQPPREGSSDVIKTLVGASSKYIGFIKRSELNNSVKVAH